MNRLIDIGYVADHRQYGSTGKVIGGGWQIMWRDERRQTWVEGGYYLTHYAAEKALCEEYRQRIAAYAHSQPIKE